MRILCAALVVLAATSSAPCAEENTSPFEQLRTFLKSPPGDIRQAGDMAKGIPAPPATKEIPENARRIALPKPSIDSQSLTSVLASRRSASPDSNPVSIATIPLETRSWLSPKIPPCRKSSLSPAIANPSSPARRLFWFGPPLPPAPSGNMPTAPTA